MLRFIQTSEDEKGEGGEEPVFATKLAGDNHYSQAHCPYYCQSLEFYRINYHYRNLVGKRTEIYILSSALFSC
jgi:hypothetical protein